MFVMFIWSGLFHRQVSALWYFPKEQRADRLCRCDLDRLECLTPLFEVISAMSPTPFDLRVDIYVTRLAQTGQTSDKLDSQALPLSEKTNGEHDAEALSSLPTLSRESSGTDQASDNDKPIRDSLLAREGVSSLYTLHTGRPDVPAIVKSFGADAVGESIAVGGKWKSRASPEPVEFCTDGPASLVCGPGRLSVDAGNACAALQLGILRGKGPAEVALHSEAFTW